MTDKIWIKIICPIWSLIVNILYWIFHFHKLASAKKEKGRIKENTHDIDDIREQIRQTVWVPDIFHNWTPWVITFIARGLKDDCRMSHSFGQFLFDCAGIESVNFSLLGKVGGHAICVSQDGKWMVGNGTLTDLKKLNCTILDRFNGIYNRIM